MKAWFLASSVVLLASSTASAQVSGHPFGLGLQLGDPTGITIEYGLDARSSLQGTLGWGGPYWRDRGMITLDWTYKLVPINPRSNVKMDFYLGVGGAIGFYGGTSCYEDRFGRRVCFNDAGFGLWARVPLGFAVHFTEVHLEPYIEIVPAIYLFGPGVGGMGGIGLRYFF